MVINNRYLEILILLIFISILVYMFHPYYRTKRLNELFCEENKSFKDLNFNGVLNKKYRDSANHLYKTININKTVTDLSDNRIILDLERGVFFNEINIGDSIVKPQGTLEVLVYRKNSSVVDTFNLHFGCED